MHTVIAIDGPSASGKSTVARSVARRLGYLYVDSGAVYRGVTWEALQQGIDTADARAVGEAVSGWRVELHAGQGAVCFTIEGREPVAALRSESVNRCVSPVAAVPAVRRCVVGWLRDALRFGALVMEGRDIGTAVFPDAAHKFYLDADPAERARRRQGELAGAGRSVALGRVADSLARRDVIDRTRAADPLQVAPGAVVIDSTSLAAEEVVSLILEHVRRCDAPA